MEKRDTPVSNNFERSLFGIILYVESIHKLYPNICIPSIDLDSYYEKAYKIYIDLHTLTKEECKEKYSFLFSEDDLDYHDMIDVIEILNVLIKNTGNVLYVDTLNPLEKMEDIGNINWILNELKKCQYRFFLCPIIMWDSFNSTGHANLLFIDREKRIVERYEPNGSDPDDPEEFFNFSKLDKMLGKIFVDLLDYKEYIIPPKDSEISCVGLQTMEHYFLKTAEGKKFGAGFCLTWSFLYGILRIENPEKTPFELRDIALDLLSKKIEECVFPKIQRVPNPPYVKCGLLSEQEKKEFVTNVKKLIKYVQDFISERHKDMNKEILKINKIFNKKYYLQGSTLYRM